MRLNLRLNPKIIIMGLLLATATHATTIYPLPQTFSDKLVTKVRTCKFNLFFLTSIFANWAFFIASVKVI